MKPSPLGWIDIVRLGLVQSALGAIVALTTSTLNRVMVVEEAIPAILPAAFVAWHYVVQLSRPRWGHGSDMGRRRTPWIIGGMGVLALGGVIATDATVMINRAPVAGLLIGFVGFSMIGAGAGAAGTSLLALLATRVAPQRRAAAASVTWIMMIAGIVVSSAVCGALLQPFSAQRLATVASCLSGIGFLLALLAVWRIESEATPDDLPEAASAHRPSFGEAIAEIRADPVARRFTVFVFLSMFAYSAQELILEPFAGLVFNMTPGASAQLSGVQNGGVLLGMVLVGVLGARFGDRRSLWMRRWTVAGCLGSAIGLAGLAAASLVGPAWPIAPTAFGLGLANGVFAVSAIGSMMGLAGAGRESREGVRMGVWGAAQAFAFAIGGFLGAVGVGALRDFFHQPAPAFLAVFCAEAIAFLAAALLATRLDAPSTRFAGANEAAARPIEFGGVRG
jgi:BCD family chlorophyll transporter-like MFS transporter